MTSKRDQSETLAGRLAEWLPAARFDACLAKRAAVRLLQCLTLSLIGLGCMPQAVSAQSITISPDNTRNFPAQPSAKLSGNLPIGTVIGTQVAGYTLGTNGITCQLSRMAVVNGTLVSGYTNVYRTSNASIGIRFSLPSQLQGSPLAYAPQGVTLVTVSNGSGPASGTNPVNYSGYYEVRAEYIIVAAPVAGTVSGTPEMVIGWTGNGCGNVSQNTFHKVASGVTNFTISTCSVTTPSVAVSLPSILASSLQPVGTTGGTQSFSIGLNCITAGTRVSITMTDSSDPANRTTLLGLMPGSTAQGVKLRILRSGTAIAFGADSIVPGNPNQILLNASTPTGAQPFEFTTQYISTGTITAGSVNAIATFTMSYQ